MTGIPFVITNRHKEQLRAKGYTGDQIKQMTPEQVHDILGNGRDEIPMNALDIALNYIGRGWNPVPVEYRTKKPIGEEWQRRIITENTAPQFFNGAPMNVGVILGPTSQGLTDIDLDSTEAIVIAPYILPRTGALFGRKSKRASHRLYTTDLAVSIDNAAVAYDDPRAKKEKHPERPARLVELRIGGGDKGAQTVFPGSVHKTNELINWEESGEPAAVDGEQLHQRVAALAAYCLLARYWPAQGGGHHDAAKVVGGLLSRAGRSPETIRIVVEAIAKATGSDRWKELCRTAEDAAKAHRGGKRAYGMPELRNTFGEDIANKVADWLNYREVSEEQPPQLQPQQGTIPTQSVPLYSDEDLALRFAGRHQHNLRHVNEWGRWMSWDEYRWQFDNTLMAFDLSRAICRDTAAECKNKKIRTGLTSAKTVAAIERLAKADRRIAAEPERWNTPHWDFNIGE